MNRIGRLQRFNRGFLPTAASNKQLLFVEKNTSKILTEALVRRTIHMSGFKLTQFAAIAGGSALLSGSYYTYLNYDRIRASHLSTSAIHMKQENMKLAKMPDFRASVRIDGPTKLNFNLTLFQYCSCPFCCKTRTFLDYFGVNYNIVEVNPVLRKELKWSPNYRKVPILLAHANGQSPDQQQVYQINDSSVIISALGSYLLSRRTMDSGDKTQSERDINDLGKILVNYQSIEVEEDGKKRSDVPNRYFLMLGDIGNVEFKKREVSLAEERMWREWADKHLVHSLSPNIYRTLPEALQAFNNFSKMGNWEKHFSPFERYTAIYVGSLAMWLIGKRLKKRYALKDDVRESLYDYCRQWLKSIGKERRFMGGKQPNLADLSVFGVLSSIEGCAAFDDLCANTDIKPWYYAVKESCNTHAGNQMIQTI